MNYNITNTTLGRRLHLLAAANGALLFFGKPQTQLGLRGGVKVFSISTCGARLTHSANVHILAPALQRARCKPPNILSEAKA
jgi:hypothetical protein